MNFDRINELQKFVRDFNAQLEEAYKRQEENIVKEKQKELESKNKNENPRHKKQKTFVNTHNIFKEPPAWKPNKYHNDYFEEYKILNPKYFLNEWDKERINLIERSFTKERDLKYKNIKYTNSHGKEFGSSDLNKLSEIGRNIMNRFINENKERERIIKQKEEDVINHKKSKPNLEQNKWKYNNFHGKEFEKLRIDQVHFFKKDPRPEYLIKDPFKVPKINGDYFEKLKYQ